MDRQPGKMPGLKCLFSNVVIITEKEVMFQYNTYSPWELCDISGE